MTMKLDFPYLSAEKSRHGTPRLYVRRHGRRIKISESLGSPAFLRAYQSAIARLEKPTAPGRPEPHRWPRGSFGELAHRYFAAPEFTGLDPISQRTRRQVIEACLIEPHTDTDPDPMGNCPVAHLTPKKIKRLRDLKGKKHGAANNRRKYLSAMFGWAIEADHMAANPVRDVKAKKYASSGFYTWTVEDVRRYEARHPVGTKAMLALALLLYTGARKGDVVRFGAEMVRSDVLKFVPRKTRHKRKTPSEKPLLPVLRSIIERSPCGTGTFLETSFGKPFTANGFGNWFRERCDEAGLTQCTAHGLRKAGATIAVENNATTHQLMAIYDWTTSRQAETYTKAASQKKITSGAMHLIQPAAEGLH